MNNLIKKTYSVIGYLLFTFFSVLLGVAIFEKFDEPKGNYSGFEDLIISLVLIISFIMSFILLIPILIFRKPYISGIVGLYLIIAFLIYCSDTIIIGIVLLIIHTSLVFYMS
jgi:hypothetical protein